MTRNVVFECFEYHFPALLSSQMKFQSPLVYYVDSEDISKPEQKKTKTVCIDRYHFGGEPTLHIENWMNHPLAQ